VRIIDPWGIPTPPKPSHARHRPPPELSGALESNLRAVPDTSRRLSNALRHRLDEKRSVQAAQRLRAPLSLCVPTLPLRVPLTLPSFLQGGGFDFRMKATALLRSGVEGGWRALSLKCSEQCRIG